MIAEQSRKHPHKVRLSNTTRNTFGLKSSLSLVPAVIHFLSRETRRVLTLKESHTITLDFLVKAESASVHTDPWLVPTWKRIYNDVLETTYYIIYRFTNPTNLKLLTVRNQLLLMLYCSNEPSGEPVAKEAPSWPLSPCQVLMRPVESAVITTSRRSSPIIAVKGL